jgi:hypothetical protein
LKDATTDLDVVRAWWAAEPTANVGLPTGHHFDVLDVDGPQALTALEESGPFGDPDVEGPTVATPRGWHVYVEPTGRGNTVNLGGLAGVDWRGRGGYVVAPPSCKADGGTWDWMTGTPLDLGPDTPIVPAPRWVLALFDRGVAPTGQLLPVGTATPTPRGAGRTGYGAGALEREVGRVTMAPVGARNHQLNRSAFNLGRLVMQRSVTAEESGNALLRAAVSAGLGEAEALATIRSGLRSGIDAARRVTS